MQSAGMGSPFMTPVDTAFLRLSWCSLILDRKKRSNIRFSGFPPSPDPLSNALVTVSYTHLKKDRIRAGIKSAVMVSVAFCIVISLVVWKMCIRDSSGM